MVDIQVLRPPQIVPVGEPVIFLNGPIQGAWDWQAKAVELIRDRVQDQRLVIASPKRDKLAGDFVYEQQVGWETHYRQLAHEGGVNLFWLAAETEHDCSRAYAQTSRAELFESKLRHQYEAARLVVGIAYGFSGTKYILHRFGQDCPDVPICKTLETTCRMSLELLRDVPITSGA
jgi:hypothetical protein